MDVYHGMGTFPGIAIGKIQYYRGYDQNIRKYTITDTEKELVRFQKARKKAIEELQEWNRKEQAELGRGPRQMETYIQLLENSSFIRAIESMVVSEKVNVSYAIATTKDELSTTFAKLDDAYVKSRVESIRYLSERLIGILDSISKDRIQGEDPVILVSRELSPAHVVEMDQKKLLAIVTKQGSPISHTSILAKTINIPVLIGVSVDAEWDGCTGIVDGYNGTLYVEPDEDTLRVYRDKQQRDQKKQAELLKLRDAKDVTKDGTKVELLANIANLEDLDSVLSNGASGIGLLRSEFQYLGRENYPREGELYRVYRQVAQTMGDRKVVIRTVDLGADKQASYMDLPQELNPAMGNRGIRVCLDRKKMFRAQIRAIYRASIYGNLSIMYPMITSMREVEEIWKIVSEVKESLSQREIPYKDIPNGIMVETPAAAMIIPELAQKADFISLGTNDLTQYVLAMDAQNPQLEKKFDRHHPAVLRMMEMVIKATHEAGKKVLVCGELAAEKAMIPYFLKLNVDALSMAPACILPARKAVRNLDLTKM
ncbi:MAG TPA: phosphoenolpyruvate--protein phosphotransferase [Candidatus Blautia intestinigallinarum]|nr:phosphoenolpyruvate--protein phosphotransferase [Candidatus Blautia intestinigallinarum]